MSRLGRVGPFVLVLVLDLAGGGLALLMSVRHWQTVSTPQPSRVDVLELTGRAVDSASTALALVALAGVVAVLATRGVVRRVIGVVLALAGVGLVWRAIVSGAAVGTARARTLVQDAHRTVDARGVTPHVVTHPQWAVLSGVGGVLVLAAGLLLAWRGHRWLVMSARYEAPGPGPGEPPAAADDEDEQQRRTRAATALWSALDRGEDPTR